MIKYDNLLDHIKLNHYEKALNMESIHIAILIFISLFLTACAHKNSNESSIDESLALVYINNGSIQCESSGLSEAETAQQLINKGIDVISSQCGFLTGIAAPAQCGLPGTLINLHVINAQNTPDAKELGFELASSLKIDNSKGYEIMKCQDRQ